MDETEDGEQWTHPETGLVATSKWLGADDWLVLGTVDGNRPGAALVLLALADFGLLEALEVGATRGPTRVFRAKA